MVSASERPAQELQDLVSEACQKHQIPGAAVGVWQDGRETIACHGVTSVADPLPISARTLFFIGSTSKTFTATALMSLVESGRLRLDDRVIDHMPDLVLADADARAALRVGHLLDHTAGWVGDASGECGFGADALARAVREIISKAEQLTPPGSIVSYNNTAVTLAGRLLEVVTGESFEDAVRRLVLDPLELRETWLSPWEVAQRPLAVGHALLNGEHQVQQDWPEDRGILPCGGVISSVGDQLRYARFHLHGGPALTAETRLSMQRQRIAARSGVTGIGIAWLLRDYGSTRIVEHGGNLDNLHLSSFTLVPDADLAVTTLTNSAGGAELAPTVLKHVLTAAGIPAPAPLAPHSVDPGSTHEYVGSYDSGQWWLHVTAEEHGGLSVRTELKPDPEIPDEVRATFEGPPVALIFVSDDVVARTKDPRAPSGDFVRDESGHVRFFRYGLRLSRRVAT